jgi:hypothetical protein
VQQTRTRNVAGSVSFYDRGEGSNDPESCVSRQRPSDTITPTPKNPDRAWDIHANKTVIACGSDCWLVIGYTGLAYFDNKPTDSFIASVIAGPEPYTIGWRLPFPALAAAGSQRADTKFRLGDGDLHDRLHQQ